ncbi:MAG: TfoX/Sxy family protein [Saprospiraceae bacterium]|nr:TfoX/Sxy family protein [Saprospiraceae bacterium]
MKETGIKKVSALRNIGQTIERRLQNIGIHTMADLANIRPVQAYLKLQAKSDSPLPICYYLYSLQGALMDTHWDQIPGEIKKSLRVELAESMANDRAIS